MLIDFIPDENNKFGRAEASLILLNVKTLLLTLNVQQEYIYAIKVVIIMHIHAAAKCEAIETIIVIFTPLSDAKS